MAKEKKEKKEKDGGGDIVPIVIVGAVLIAAFIFKDQILAAVGDVGAGVSGAIVGAGAGGAGTRGGAAARVPRIPAAGNPIDIQARVDAAKTRLPIKRTTKARTKSTPRERTRPVRPVRPRAPFARLS
jgi:hypothetical protein